MARATNLPAYRQYRVLFECGSLSGLSDGELLGRFANCENRAADCAFAAIVERHASKVLSICRAIVRNEHDAEDAFQATFFVLAIKARKLQAHESLGPWLSAVARRVASGARAKALGREARERRVAGERAGDALPIQSVTTSPRCYMKKSTACRNDIAFRSCSATWRASLTRKQRGGWDGRSGLSRAGRHAGGRDFATG